MTVSLNLVRAQDIITIGDESFVIKECWNANGIFQLKVEKNGKDIILSYNIAGDSLEDPSLNISNLEMVELPEDSLTYYYPKFSVELLPILKINGEDKIIYKLLDLNGLEIKEPQVLEASYKYTVIAMLIKRKGREMSVIKQEKIICDTKEACEEKLKEIENSFKGLDAEDEKSAKESFRKSVDTLLK